MARDDLRPIMFTMRAGEGDRFSDAAAANMVGQTPRLNLPNLGDDATATVLAATVVDDGRAIDLTLGVDPAEYDRVAGLFSSDRPKPGAPDDQQ